MIKISTFDSPTLSQNAVSPTAVSPTAVSPTAVSPNGTSFQFGGGRGLGPLVATSPISPCSVCGSPILWETATGEVRCYCCSPPASAHEVEQKIDVLIDEDGSAYAHYHGSNLDDRETNDVAGDAVGGDAVGGEAVGGEAERKIFSRIVSSDEPNCRVAAYLELDELLDEIWMAGHNNRG